MLALSLGDAHDHLLNVHVLEFWERRTVSPVSRTPVSPRAYRQRAEGVEQEVRFDDFEARIGALEAMAVTHAQLLQQVHTEAKGIAQNVGQVVEKIKNP